MIWRKNLPVDFLWLALIAAPILPLPVPGLEVGLLGADLCPLLAVLGPVCRGRNAIFDAELDDHVSLAASSL